MAKYSHDQIRELPSELQDHYFDAAVEEKYFEEIFPLLDKERVDRLKDLVLDVYFRKQTPIGFVSALKEIVPDQEKYAQILPRVLGYDFLPLADYFGEDIIALIADNGGDPLMFRTKVAVSEVAGQIRKKAKEVTMPNERLEKRLLNILRSKASNARTDDQVKEMLMGPTKTSGVGLDEGQAAIVMMYASEEVEKIKQRGIDIVSDEQYAQEMRTPTAPVEEEPKPEVGSEAVVEGGEGQEEVQKEGPKPEPEPKKPQLDAFTTEDKAEIDDLKDATVPHEVTRKERAIEFTLEGLSDAALDSSGVEFDAEMHKRFRYIVDLYYRDLRDALETKSKLTMPTQSGGMGLDDTQTASVMALLKKRIGEYRKFMQTKALAEKERSIKKQQDQQKENEEQAEASRKDSLDRRFEELTGKDVKAPAAAEGGAEDRSSVPPQGVPKVIEVVSHDEEEEPEKGEGGEGVVAQDEVSASDSDAQSVQPDDTTDEASKTGAPPGDLPEVPGSSVGEKEAKDVDAEMSAEESKAEGAPTEKPKAEKAVPDAVTGAVKTAVEPPLVPVTPPSTLSPVVRQTAKPVVSDVKFTPKLTGPVEELRALTLVDFRRLSKDPKEATLKIMDKIELLQNTSFETKAEGVKAWHGSPANVAYLEVLKKSLEGKPVADVLDEMLKEDPEALVKQEFEALMDLNRTIRFG